MKQRRWLELIGDYGLDILYYLVKINLVSDTLSRMPVATYLNQQKEILEDMESLVLDFVLSGITAQFMALQRQLWDMIREAQTNDWRL